MANGHLRQPWPAYFLDIAEMVSSRATCPRLRVGAVLTLENRILSTGYNGVGGGEEHCIDVGCDLQPCTHEGSPHTVHCQRSIHAEINAYYQALDQVDASYFDQHKDRIILYCTHEPCPECRQVLLLAGITEYRWRNDY